jgi:hypothetical protein
MGHDPHYAYNWKNNSQNILSAIVWKYSRILTALNNGKGWTCQNLASYGILFRWFRLNHHLILVLGAISCAKLHATDGEKIGLERHLEMGPSISPCEGEGRKENLKKEAAWHRDESPVRATSGASATCRDGVARLLIWKLQRHSMFFKGRMATRTTTSSVQVYVMGIRRQARKNLC